VASAPGRKFHSFTIWKVHTRLLGAVPLLLASETIVHRWLRPLVMQFADRGTVTTADHERFEGLIESAMRLRNSVTIELVLLAGAIGFGIGSGTTIQSMENRRGTRTPRAISPAQATGMAS
jgi:hypothetical protein